MRILTLIAAITTIAIAMGACTGSIDNKQLAATADSLRSAGVPDSLATLGAKALLMDADDFANTQAQILINDLATGSVNAEKATVAMNDINAIAKRVGRDDTADAFNKALDRLANELPLDKQMLVYTRATTPESLAKALKQELNQPGADRQLIQRQIEQARKIYSGGDLDAFNKALE